MNLYTDLLGNILFNFFHYSFFLQVVPCAIGLDTSSDSRNFDLICILRYKICVGSPSICLLLLLVND